MPIGSNKGMKVCTGCREEKPVAEYYKNRSNKDGLAVQCKACRLAESATRYAANPKKYIAKTRAHYDADPQKQSVLMSARRIRYNLAAYILIGGPFCLVCNHDYMPSLEIHHAFLDGKARRTKLQGMGYRGGDRAMVVKGIISGDDRRMDLIPLCRNCHAKVHAGNIDLSPYVGFNVPLPVISQRNRAIRCRERAIRVNTALRTILGNGCACGETAWEAIDLHHVNNDGTARNNALRERLRMPPDHGIQGGFYNECVSDGRESREGIILICKNHHKMLHQGHLIAVPSVTGGYDLQYRDGQPLEKCTITGHDFSTTLRAATEKMHH